MQGSNNTLLTNGRRWLRVSLLTAAFLGPFFQKVLELSQSTLSKQASQAREAAGSEIGKIVEKAQELVESANKISPRLSELASAELQNLSKSRARMSKSRTLLYWAVGTSIGMLVAGTGAFILIRRRIHPKEEVVEQVELVPAPPIKTEIQAFVGNKATKEFYPYTYVENIPEDDRCYFNSEEEAVKAGFQASEKTAGEPM